MFSQMFNLRPRDTKSFELCVHEEGLPSKKARLRWVRGHRNFEAKDVLNITGRTKDLRTLLVTTRNGGNGATFDVVEGDLSGAQRLEVAEVAR